MNQPKFESMFGAQISDTGAITTKVGILKTGSSNERFPKTGTPNDTNSTEKIPNDTNPNQKIPNDTNPNETNPNHRKLNDESIRYVQSILSVADIFLLTPPIEDAINSCTFRTPNTFRITRISNNRNLETKNIESCLKYFSIKKFFFLEYICYKYVLIGKNNSKIFTFDEIANAPAGPGTVYEITPGGAFEEYKQTKIIAHTADMFPYETTSFAPVIDRDSDQLPSGRGVVQKSSPGAKFILSYFTLREKRLESPFETNCFNYRTIEAPPTETRTDCRQMCVMRNMIEYHDRVPFSSISIHPRKQKVVSYNDLENETILNDLFSIHRKCSQLCKKPDCKEITTFTKIRTRVNGMIAMRMTLSDAPSISINYKPVMRLIEYGIYMLSILGAWFGVSIHGAINPFKFELKKQLGDRLQRKSNVEESKKLNRMEKYFMKRFSVVERKISVIEKSIE